MANELDPNRAAFVKQEYRYANEVDGTVLARNPSAVEVTVDTNLDETAATALAAKYLAENNEPRVFEVTIQGVFSVDDFIGGPPQYIADFARLHTDGRTMKVTGCSVDHTANRTTFRIRG